MNGKKIDAIQFIQDKNHASTLLSAGASTLLSASLGNVRVSYTQDPETGALSILEEAHYYPFGLQHTHYNSDLYKISRKEEQSSGGDKKSVAQFSKYASRFANPGYNYKFNGKELQSEFGVEMYDFGFRNYDPAIGRWMNVDPLADHPNLVQYSPYVYAVNNPVFHTDPDGRCPPWICGALLGGLVEAGSQYIVNLAKGDSWTEAALNIDGADVLAATIEGGVTGGGSVARRLLVKGAAMVTSEVVKASIDAKIGDVVKEGLDGVEIKTDKSEIAAEAVIGIGANLLGEGVKGTMKTVVNSKHAKELTQVNKEINKSMKGSNGEAVRTKNQAQLQSTIKGNEAASEATGTVTTEVVDEKLNGNI